MDLISWFIGITVISMLSLWKKRIWIIFIILLFCCFILMGYNIQNPDYDNYVDKFEFASYPDTNNILSLLDVSDTSFQALCKDFGMQTYEQYRLLLTGLILTIFGWFTYKECAYCNIFLSIYIACYLIIDIVQIRNFEAFVILMPFIPLLSKRMLISTIVYIGGVLLSTTFHFSMIYFLLFAFIGIPSRRNRLIITGSLLVILAPISMMISDSVAVSRVAAYERSGVLGALFGIFFVILNYYIIKMVSKMLLNQSGKKSEICANTKLNPHFMEELNFMLLFICPFFFINATINRLFRYTSIINVIFLLNAIHSLISYKIKVRLSVVLILYITYFAIRFVYNDSEVYMTVLIHNSFWKN